MKQCAIVLLLLMATTYTTLAQSSKAIDSLNLLIAQEKQDTSRVLLLNKLAIMYQYANPGKSLQLAQQSLALARQIDFEKGQGNCLTITGNVFWVTGNYPKALQEHLEALKIRERINDKRGMGVSYSNIGSIYSEQGDEQKALEYVLKAKAIAEAIHNDALLASALTNGSDSYEKLNILDSARLFAQLGYNMAERTGDNETKGLCLNNLGNIYAKMGKPQLAMEYYKNSIPESIAGNNDEMLCEAKLGIAVLFNKMGNADSALAYAHQSLATAQKNGFVKRIVQAATFLSAYFKQKGLIDSAYAYMEINTALKDSIYGQEKTSKVQAMLLDEQSRQRDMELKKLMMAEERKRNMQIIGIAAFIPLFFGIVLILRKRRIKPVIVKLLGLLGLLLLFEFIALFIHPYIEEWTGHRPIFMLLALVCIASILVPLHHTLEKWVAERVAHKNEPVVQKPVEEMPGEPAEPPLPDTPSASSN